MKAESNAVVRQWLADDLPDDVARALDRLARTDDVAHLAIMPDVHLSKDVCTGAALATRNRLYPQAVGGDIGCGMAAIRFDAPASLLADERASARLLHGLYRTVPAMRHGRATMIDRLPGELPSTGLSHSALEKVARRDGRAQFATLGRGNHFLEFQADADGDLWLMVHSGSRALGQAITAHHLRQTQAANTGLRFLEAESEAGQAYLHDLNWACRYAAASRSAMTMAVGALLTDLFQVSADPGSVIHCNHNHLRFEQHFGEPLWVHRKGAVSAAFDEPGVIPGSMGTASFHVIGRGATEALGTSSHGAGRRMSRTDAQRKVTTRDLERQMRGVWFDHRLADRLRDEAPEAYKDIHSVMRAQRELTCIVRKLRPILSYKGG